MIWLTLGLANFRRLGAFKSVFAGLYLGFKVVGFKHDSPTL